LSPTGASAGEDAATTYPQCKRFDPGSRGAANSVASTCLFPPAASQRGSPTRHQTAQGDYRIASSGQLRFKNF
jgi:hypothetical protein